MPTVTIRGFFDMQVCVPKNWTDEQVLEFADAENPTGTERGWHIRREGSELLKGQPERRPCDERKDFVHIMLDF